MHKLRLLGGFFAFSIATSAFSETSDLPVDKAAHFGLSTAATATLIRLGQATNPKHKITFTNRFISSLLVFGAGYAKEVMDKRKKEDNALDAGDLNADGAGVVYGNLLMIEF